MILRAFLLLAVIALLTAGCGGQPVSTARHTGGPVPAPVSCRQQYSAWKSGPVRTPARRLAAALSRIQAARKAGNPAAVKTGTGRLAPIALAMARHPIPHCADPAALYQELVTRIYVAGSAGTPSRLPLSAARLKNLQRMEHQLTAEAGRVTAHSQ